MVTGGASGIGDAVVRRLAADGARVTVADLNGAAARDLAKEVSGEAWEVDLSETDALASQALSTDILVNNAGIQRISRLEDFDPADFRVIMKVMLEAPFLLIRATLPTCTARDSGAS